MLSSELDCRYDPFTREQACELLWMCWPWHTRACLFCIHVMTDQWMLFHSMYSTVTFASYACLAHEFLLPATSVLQHLLSGSVFIVWLGCIHVCVSPFSPAGCQTVCQCSTLWDGPTELHCCINGYAAVWADNAHTCTGVSHDKCSHTQHTCWHMCTHTLYDVLYKNTLDTVTLKLEWYLCIYIYIVCMFSEIVCYKQMQALF